MESLFVEKTIFTNSLIVSCFLYCIQQKLLITQRNFDYIILVLYRPR